MAVTKEGEEGLTRAQIRLLRRIYNGRTLPVIVGGRPFLTYKQAIQYLRALSPEDYASAYAVMKDQAKSARHAAAE